MRSGGSTRMIALRGELRVQEPMSRHTTWRVGGPAAQWYRPADCWDLSLFLSQQPLEKKLIWLGLGSNLLIRDHGLQATVIATQGGLSHIELHDDSTVRVEAGVPCAQVARFCARHNLCGLEFLAGIPGTMGGALAMNAGAWGGETWDRVIGVETITRRGQRKHRQRCEYDIAYRHCQRQQGFEDEWFTAARLQLEPGDGKAALVRIRKLLEQRNRTQPTGVASCGSVFRNPPGDYAARLIEASGLKGLRVGGACVSDKHANFIINHHRATAADIELLIEQIMGIVYAKQGVRLVPEVHIMGDS